MATQNQEHAAQLASINAEHDDAIKVGSGSKNPKILQLVLRNWCLASTAKLAVGSTIAGAISDTAASPPGHCWFA